MTSPRLLLMALLGLALASCAKPRPLPAETPISFAGIPNAPQSLLHLAEAEQKRTPTIVHDIPTPPGLEPDALAPRLADAPHARLTLQQALEKFASDRPAMPVAPPAEGKVNSEAQSEALRLYAKARGASLDRLYLQATIDLQKAHELDPASPQIMRELARCYIAQNRTSLAVEIYEKLLHYEPHNSEALFTVALAAANRRDFARAARLLAEFRVDGQSFAHDPAADVLADFSLAIALRELGYDRASIESAKAALESSEKAALNTDYRQRLDSVYRQRADTWRAIGDAHCRLGEYSHALTAYINSASLPNPDPSALHPRVIYAHLSLGEVYSAQIRLLEFLTNSQNGVAERDIRLCGYVAEHAQPVETLASAVERLQQERPQDSGIVRAAASLMPAPKARGLLQAFVNRQPRDLESVTQLLVWLSQESHATAVELTVALAGQHPDLAGAYTDRLAVACPDACIARDAIRNLPPSIGRALVEARLLVKSHGYGEAWDVCRAARQQWPNDVSLMVQELQLAAAMQEAGIFEQSLASMPAQSSAPWFIGIAQAYRALGQSERAAAFAQQAVDVDPANIDALIELARAMHGHASVLAADPATKPDALQFVERASEICEQIIAIDPQRDESYEVLIMMYAPGGALADTKLFRQARERLGRANPQSAVFLRLNAQELTAQKRYEHAIERLVTLYDSNPADQSSLTQAVTVWQQWGRLDAAQQWIEQRLAVRPGDPALFQQAVRVQLLLDQTEEALTRVQQRLLQQPEDLAARRILETVYQLAGQVNAAREVGEARLLARPPGIRREIELAELYRASESAERAIERLTWVSQHAEHATQGDLTTALSIASRLGGDSHRRDQLILDLVHTTINRFPSSGLLQVYGPGLVAIAKTSALSREFDALADQAVRQAGGAREQKLQGAMVWRELAQFLIDAKLPEAAAAVLRTRLRYADKTIPLGSVAVENGADAPSPDASAAHIPLDSDAAAVLARLTLVSDAAAAAKAALTDEDAARALEVQHAERAIAFISALERQGILKQTLGLATRANVSDAFDEVSQYFSKLGAKNGAVRLIQEQIRIEPNDAMALNNMGYMMLEQGRNDDDVVSTIERAFKITPNEPNLLDTVGWLRYKQGRFDDLHPPAEEIPLPGPDDASALGSLSLITRAIEASRELSPEVMDHLGDAQWRVGRTSDALESWRRTVKLLSDPGFQQAQTQQNAMLQARVWLLLVEDAVEMYDREFGAVLERVKAKVAAAEQGNQPPIAPTFDEMQAAQPNP
jgi:tetratricopeptide (TPR) repeat protein